MSRGYLNTNLASVNIKKLKAHLPEAVFNSIEFKKLEEVNDSEMSRIVSRITRHVAYDMEKMHKVMANWVQYKDPKLGTLGTDMFSVPVIPHPTRDGEVVVFPGMKINPKYLREFSTLKSLSPRHLFNDVYEPLLKEAAEKEQQYATPRRIIAKVGKREVMPFSRALARYRRADVTLDDKTLLKLHERYMESVKGFTVIYCEKPEDYVQMYEKGLTSCMVQGGSGNGRTWSWMTSKGVHPTSFYHYCPHTRGAYVVRDGAVIARTILLEDINGKKYYSRCYYSNPEVLEKFIMSLQKAGYLPFSGNDGSKRGSAVINCEFKVPSIFYNGSYTMPLPYMDNISGPMTIDFDETTKEFTVYFGTKAKKGVGVQTQSTSGYYVHTGVSTTPCAHCGERRAVRVVSIDGNHFCSESCMRHARYGMVMRSDGLIVCQAVRGFEPRVGHQLYSNLQAMIDLGYKQYVNGNLWPEDKEFVAPTARAIIATLAPDAPLEKAVNKTAIISQRGSKFTSTNNVHRFETQTRPPECEIITSIDTRAMEKFTAKGIQTAPGTDRALWDKFTSGISAVTGTRSGMLFGEYWAARGTVRSHSSVVRLISTVRVEIHDVVGATQ